MKILFFLLLLMVSSPALCASVNMNIDEVFLLNDEKLEGHGNWKGVFCDRGDQSICEISSASVWEAKSHGRRQLNGNCINSINYKTHNGRYAKFFIKGLDSEDRKIESINTFKLYAEIVSFNWDNILYKIIPTLPTITIESEAANVSQTISVYNDNGSCADPTEALGLPNTKIWVADIDHDEKPDFYIESYGRRGSCWYYTSDPQILIYSTGARDNEIGGVSYGKHTHDDVCPQQMAHVNSDTWSALSDIGGKDEQVIFSYSEKPLSHYKTSIVVADNDVKWTVEHDKAQIADSKHWKIGNINGHDIIEVWIGLNSDSGYYNSIKLILIETSPGQYRPLYQLQDRERELTRFNASINGDVISIPPHSRHGTSMHIHEIDLGVDASSGIILVQ